MPRYEMAFRPSFVHPWVHNRGPFPMFGQHFGLAMGIDHRGDHFQPFVPFQYYGRPWRNSKRGDKGSSRVEMDKDGFKMIVDVKHFKPEEITVNQVEDSVVVEAKHEETEDEHGYASRHFVRRYTLPEGVDPQALNSTLSSDGVLTITASKVKQMNEGNVHTIPIKHTGKPVIPGAEKKPSRGEDVTADILTSVCDF